MNSTCYLCGCGIGRHSDTGCHGVQAMTPWDREPCTCGLTRDQAAGVVVDPPLSDLELDGIGTE